MRWILFSYEVKEDLCVVACCSVGKRGKRNNILRRADANNSSYNYCVEVDKITFENCLPCPTKSTWILTRSHFEVLLIAHSLLLQPLLRTTFATKINLVPVPREGYISGQNAFSNCCLYWSHPFKSLQHFAKFQNC